MDYKLLALRYVLHCRIRSLPINTATANAWLATIDPSEFAPETVQNFDDMQFVAAVERERGWFASLDG